MLACILFVFGALVEYAAILFRRQKDEVAEVSRVSGAISMRNPMIDFTSPPRMTEHVAAIPRSL